MKAVTRGQLSEIVARFATQVRWDDISGEALQKEVVNLSPEEFSNRFTRFLKNGARTHILGDLKIAPKSFDPVKFISKGWSLIPEEHDSRNDALTEVDSSKILFETCLKDDETSITGEEKLKRLKANGNIRLGSNVFLGLWENYQTKKENSVLEQLYREKGITYVDFFGDVLIVPGGGRVVLCLYRRDGEWYWDCSWLVDDWPARTVSASLAS